MRRPGARYAGRLARSRVERADAPPPSDRRDAASRACSLLRTLVVTFVLGLSVWLLATRGPARRARRCGCSRRSSRRQYVAIGGVRRAAARGIAPQRVARPMLASDLVLTSRARLAHRRRAEPVHLPLRADDRRGGRAVVPARRRGRRPWSRRCSRRCRDGRTRCRCSAQPTVGADRLELVRTLGINCRGADRRRRARRSSSAISSQRGAETLATTRRAAAELLTLHQDIVRSLVVGAHHDDARRHRAHGERIGRRDPAQTPDKLAGEPIDSVMPGIAALLERRADLTVRRTTTTRHRRHGVAAARRARSGRSAASSTSRTSPSCGGSSSTRGAPSASRPSVSSPRVSRTRSATRSRRSPARSSCCASRRRRPTTTAR